MKDESLVLFCLIAVAVGIVFISLQVSELDRRIEVLEARERVHVEAREP